jgi:16S rRNA (uracil1498-N3)-methyltransferase
MKTTKHTFFCSNIQSGVLSEEESHHAGRVLRLKPSDLVTLIDGKGHSAVAELLELTKKQVFYKIINAIFEEASLPYIHIAIAPTKSMDRFEFFLEKATELGVSEITPLKCKNSERKQIKKDRLEKIVLAATKQSGNLYLPKINELIDYEMFIKNISEHENVFIAHCEEDLKKNEFKDMLKNQKKITILIGPEGDFSKEEINLAKEKKISPVSLGQTRLRTETAGIIACHTVKLILS